MLDPRDNGAFVYATPGSTKAIGVVTEASPYRGECVIATLGDKCRVYVSGTVVKGDVIRAAKVNDNISLGTCTKVSASTSTYLKIGTALNSGSGLIETVLELTNIGGGSTSDSYVPYTGATSDVDLGDKNFSTTGTVTIPSYDEFVIAMAISL